MSRRLRLYFALGLVVVGAVATGVTTLSGLSGQGPQPGTGTGTGTIGLNASDRLTSLDGLNATVTMETTFDEQNETQRSTARLSARPGTGLYRQRYTSGAQADQLVVSNRSVQWIYDRRNNSVRVTDIVATDPRYVRRGERLERLFARLNVSRAATDDQKRVSPSGPGIGLPFGGPQAQVTTRQTRSTTGNVTLVYNGTATVSGREAYVLEIVTPSRSDEGGPATFGNFTQKLYVDTEWFLTLRQETAFAFNGTRFRSTRVLHDVTVNPGLDDSLFEFTPPANATVSTTLPNIERTVYTDRAALRRNTTLPVPEPTLPGSFDFDDARLTTGEFRSLALNYVNSTAQLSVRVSPWDGDPVAANGTEMTGERVTINGQNATYRRFATTQTVGWSCAGYRYSVRGQGVTRALLIETAQSVDCD